LIELFFIVVGGGGVGDGASGCGICITSKIGNMILNNPPNPGHLRPIRRPIIYSIINTITIWSIKGKGRVAKKNANKKKAEYKTAKTIATILAAN
jgi:hypothetical protein